MELVVLVGLQAAGKTTFVLARFAATHIHVSKDHFRKNRRPARRQRHLIAEALAAGRSVIVDNTNPTAAERAELVALAREFGAVTVCYYFPPDPAGSLRRNADRTGTARVPDVGVYATLKRLEPPTPSESFDRQYEVHFASGGEFDVREVKG